MSEKAFEVWQLQCSSISLQGTIVVALLADSGGAQPLDSRFLSLNKGVAIFVAQLHGHVFTITFTLLTFTKNVYLLYISTNCFIMCHFEYVCSQVTLLYMCLITRVLKSIYNSNI